MPALFVGIDVSQDRLDVHILPDGRVLQVDNTPAGHRQLLDTLRPLVAATADIRVGLESTGGLELPVALAFQEAGCEVAVLKPERVRYFAKAGGQLAKTDPIDAAVIARFIQAVPVPVHPLPAEEIRHFRDLLDRRAQLVQMKSMETSRRRTTTQKRALASIEKHVAWIEKEIERLEDELDRRIAANPQWKELDRILQTAPGFGAQMTRTVIGQLPELGCVDRKVIGQLVGLAPAANDSGKTAGNRHIVGGRKQVRNQFYMSALTAIRKTDLGRTMYARLRARGKSGKVAVIAVAHKLLTIANAMVRDMQEWRHSVVAKTA